MTVHPATWLAGLERHYTADLDVSFDRVIDGVNCRDDELLAEVIEADGRMRIARRLDVSLQRYLVAVPGLAARPVPLDAAIDVALRSMSRSSRIDPRTVQKLTAEYPHLQSAIHEAAVLNEAVWSTTGLRQRVEAPPAKPVPCDFGPTMPNGRRRYELQELLGQGASGQVYLGLDRQLSEEGHTAMVAIKILLSADRKPSVREQLLEEATKVRRISHPNVVLVHDRGVTEQDEDYIVYELVDGGDLGQRIGAVPRPMAPREAAALVASVAEGVQAAHSAGVIHCDLKPGNIMLTRGGEPKVADFGVAVRLSVPREFEDGQAADIGGIVGNIAFISPEQYRGEEGALSVQSDVYALGGILYLLLTGELPNGSTVGEIATTHDPEHGRAEAPRLRMLLPGLDRDLEAICRRALAPTGAKRHPSASALAEDLRHWLAREPIGWMKPGFFHVLKLWSRRKPALAGASALIFTLIIICGAIGAAASRQQLHVRIATLELEKKQIEDKNRATLIAALTKLRDDYRMNTELLNQIWALEHYFGPTVLDLRDPSAAIWGKRIDVIRWLVQDAHKNGRGDQMETLLWESALAFWLVCDGDHQQAEPLIEQNQRKWSARLDANDDWLAQLRALSQCAIVNRHAALAGLPGASLPDRSELERAAADLHAIDERLSIDRAGTPMHMQVIDSLAEAYGPALMNDPVRHADLTQRYAALWDSRRKKPAGTASK
jgi:predicted Ser/Thr protein kinase